jgi:hypothetical protein
VRSGCNRLCTSQAEEYISREDGLEARARARRLESLPQLCAQSEPQYKQTYAFAAPLFLYAKPLAIDIISAVHRLAVFFLFGDLRQLSLFLPPTTT